ncbi:NAD-dependent epimerase/dehydratase family protein [Arthrobacter roseus]|uniref:NAD-dependent epimerase/dehydratase family protein n=1 Tax=Arthrobacter roseus TaxID=136274 RepID=UPI00196474DD|nr:NAD-dependent epimerase/dehydratase family protein [Arthrobacter roseus]MBM7846976.1 nucleoside-diphosphate-sugar epimerase [Arthrobacter roseus]
MRKVLILGGTAWLGREIAAQLVANGDHVTCLARGESGSAPDGAVLVSADRSGADAYQQVDGEQWDEVIELSYNLDFVKDALRCLAPRTKHWTLISSVSVYAFNSEPNADEDAALLNPVDLADYGQAKVAAEQATTAAAGDFLLTVRPGLIGGPGDGSDRFGYWPARFSSAGDGPVLTPTTEGLSAQVIDVRDLAAWIIDAGSRGVTGIFNAVGDEYPLASVLEQAAAVAGFRGAVVPATHEWLLNHGVNYWAGLYSLPLWLPQEDAAMAQRSNTAFRAAGGQLRPLEHSLADVLADEQHRGLDRERRSGLTRAEELALLQLLQ